jgi:hypothetical protein
LQTEKYLAKLWGYTGIVEVLFKTKDTFCVLDGEFLRNTWFKDGIHPQATIINGAYTLEISKGYILRKLTPVEEELY